MSALLLVSTVLSASNVHLLMLFTAVSFGMLPFHIFFLEKLLLKMEIEMEKTLPLEMEFLLEIAERLLESKNQLLTQSKNQMLQHTNEI